MSKSMRRRGFTLIELLIVIVVIAILALIVIPKLMGASRKAKDSTLKANLVILRNAVELYQTDCGSYPLGTVFAGLTVKPLITDVPEGAWKGPYLNGQGGIGGASIPRNPYISASETDITKHWSYYAATGGVSFPTPTGTDANSEDYAGY